MAVFLTGQRPMKSFSPGAVATIDLWKSAPRVCKAALQCLSVTLYVL